MFHRVRAASLRVSFGNRVLSAIGVGLFLASSALAAGTLIISEFRLRGPSGANDEFVEVYNNSGADHTVAALSGTGYAIAASDGVVRCTIPNGTVIPRNGHFLCANSVAYSLGSYPAGNGTTATADATFTTDIPDNAGIALFNNNTGGGSFTLANRFDAVGSTSEANTLYKEGPGYPALTPFSIDYAWVRDTCGKSGAVNDLTPCTLGGNPKDTDDNASDFYFVDTNGTSAGGGQRLGAPGPENLSSPISGTSSIPNTGLDVCSQDFAAPNFIRDFTSDPANNSTFGTIDIRRTFTNNTGANLTRLRFRIADLDTFPAASGFADLRPRTSTAVVVTVDRPPCGSGTSNVTVQGTTLEQPPSQPNGGGFNSSMGAGTVTLGTPLANGASVDVRFLFGIQQTGNFRVAIVVEGLPAGGGASDFLFLQCSTDGPCVPPTVSSIVRADTNPTGAASVNYTVTFSQSVTGVDASDFLLATTGAVAGASVTGVSGSGSVYTVTVGTGTGNGTIRLDVVDDDSIINASTQPLGGSGAGNGNFSSGEVYTIAHAVNSYSAPSATGTGIISASFTGGGGTCTFTTSQFIGPPPGAPPIPPVGVTGFLFPQGLFDFSLGQCTAGSTVTFTIVYPQALPPGTLYWKYGRTASDTTSHWYVLPATIVGATATFSITDGGLGDDDLTPDGNIVDQGGPGVPGAAVGVPALGGPMLALLGLLLAGVGFLVTRRT